MWSFGPRPLPRWRRAHGCAIALRLGATVYATAGREEFGAAGAIGR